MQGHSQPLEDLPLGRASRQLQAVPRSNLVARARQALGVSEGMSHCAQLLNPWASAAIPFCFRLNRRRWQCWSANL